MAKKIVIVGPAFPYRGGNSLFVSHLFDLLKDHFEVKIFNYTLLYPSFLFPGTTQFDRSETIIKKAPNERIVNSINPFNWIRTARRLRNENADLVIFDWWHPFFAFCHFVISFLARPKYRGRVLFITENFISHESGLFDKILTKIGLSNADAFLTLSNIVAVEIKQAFPGKPILQAELPIYDCYIADHVSSNSFGFLPEQKILLFFGYIRHYKGLDILIRAMAELVKHDASYRLLAVGESYENIAIYTELIKELQLEEYVILENRFVSNEEVWKYYSVCDVVVLPYRSATQSGILNVAYGFKKPVIVTDVGGLSEFVDEGQTGIVIKPESVEAIVDGVQYFYKLRNSVSFEEHIERRLKNNLFYKIPEMINTYLEKISSNR